MCASVTIVFLTPGSAHAAILIDHAQGGTLVEPPNYKFPIIPGIGIPHTLISHLPDATYYAVVFFEGGGCLRRAVINSFNHESWGMDAAGPLGGFSTAWPSSGGGCMQQFRVNPVKTVGWMWGALSNTDTRNAIADENGVPAFAICDDFESCDTLVPRMPCAIDCGSSVLFLPGLEASRLYGPDYQSGTADQLWEPNAPSDVEDLFMDSAGRSNRSDIYTKDVIDEIAGMENIYKSFLSDLAQWKADGIIADYSAVPYDWRLSMTDLIASGNDVDGGIYYTGDLNATNTPYILQELRRLVLRSHNGKVSIVAHSNGGLLAKALLKRLEETGDPLLERIENLILVAVPQSGTPEAAGALLHGFKQSHWPVISAQLARDFARDLPGLYPLLPSGTYWNGGGSGVTTDLITFKEGTGYDPLDAAISRFGTTIDGYGEMAAFLAGDEGRQDPLSDRITHPSLGNATLLAYGQTLHNSLDSWTPPPHISVHQIAGWGERTLGSIEYTTKGCSNALGVGCLAGKEWKYKPRLVIDGDGTVVVPSALAMSTSSSNVKRWWVNMEEYNNAKNPTLARTHKNILEINPLREFIYGILSSSSTTSDLIMDGEPKLLNSSHLSFMLYSPLDLSATDEAGNRISSTTNSIPGARYKRFGEVQYISVPASAHPTILLDGYASGTFDLEIEEESHGTVNANTAFISVPTRQGTVASMSFAEGSIESAGPLEIDFEGDGKNDVRIEAKSGEEVVFDAEPPKVSIIRPGIADYARSFKLPVIVNASDNVGVASTSVYFGSKRLSGDPVVDLFFERLGTTTIWASAYDAQGNGATTSVDVRIIATPQSTISDIRRAYDLGWIYSSKTRDELIRKVEHVVKIDTRFSNIQEKVRDDRRQPIKASFIIDKLLTQALKRELRVYLKDKLNDRAYNLINEDLGWLIAN